MVCVVDNPSEFVPSEKKRIVKVEIERYYHEIHVKVSGATWQISEVLKKTVLGYDPEKKIWETYINPEFAMNAFEELLQRLKRVAVVKVEIYCSDEEIAKKVA